MTVGKKVALLAGGVLVSLLAVYIVGVTYVTVGLETTCNREVVDQKTSPDGRKKAAIIDHDCGATTSEHTELLITDAASAFDDHRDMAASFHGHAQRLDWAGAELRVFYGDAEPVKRPDRFRGTAVSYWRAD